MSVILTLAAAASAVPSFRLVDARSIALAEPVVRIGDVVALQRLAPPVRSRIAPLTIARLPARRTYTMDRSAVLALLRRRLPGSLFSGLAAGTITFKMPRVERIAASGCSALIQAVAIGAAITADAIGPAACGARSRATTRFDRSRQQVLAVAALPIGTHLGRLSLPRPAAVQKGETLRLVSRMGPVRIERAVAALQPGSGASRVYVRDGDRQVFSARYSVSGATR